MLASSNTGPGTYGDGNQQSPLRGARLGDLVTSDLRGRYAEATRTKLRMVGANQAAVTTSAGLATTNTGLILFNPVGSTVNLEVDKVGAAFTVVQAAVSAFGIQGGFAGAALAGVTADGQYNALVNGPVGQGLIYKAATTVAPVIKKILGAVNTGAATVNGLVPGVWDLEGSIIVPPGGWISIYQSSVSGGGSFFSFEWAEIPV